MDGDSIFGYQLQNRKRTHDQIDRSSSIHSSRRSTPSITVRDVSAGPSYSTRHPTQTHSSTAQLRLPSLRYAGDGLDYRRPMSTTSAQSEPQVIDLTSEDDTPEPPDDTSEQISPPPQHMRPASRAPRFGRNIIDLSSDPPSPPPQPTEPPLPPEPFSPEIEFVSARRLSAPQRRPDDPQRPIDLDLIDNDFEIISERPATPGNGANGPPPADSGFPLRVAGLGGVAAYRRELAQRTQALHVQLRGAEARLRWAIEEVNNRERQFGGAAFVAPQLDFMGVGFDMGLERERSASPIIVTPPPPAEGFTRSPVEGDVLVCPNCGDELALGREALKRQVWIIRACGHVYCGECTAARSKSRRKGKEPAKSMPMPFKVCVVESCGKKCSSKTSMLQLFL
ncbi:hypothetical protein H2201_006797 [Coniosporium apollinis]|uniref:RING-type domain-containing protein n=1 Tax=Coniosporium apollinis TaxID=61459 RepID=A0ABQ9NP58_9PEZI|nr:hypothetical protein H2201_006797 [Coniosporium apollinis]